LASCGIGVIDELGTLIPRSIAMSDISNIGSSFASGISQSVRTSNDAATARRSANLTSVTSRTSSQDQVQVSEVARWLQEMDRLPAIRQDKVAAAKAAIANGTLDTDDRLATAVSRMIDDIGG
jgi:flagellar biosynthesis anti-sigma factor FlgM